MDSQEDQGINNNTTPEPTAPVKANGEQRDQSPVLRRSAHTVKPPDRL